MQLKRNGAEPSSKGSGGYFTSEAQSQAHVRFSMKNTGLTSSQLQRVAEVLAEHDNAPAARRMHGALAQALAAEQGPRL